MAGFSKNPTNFSPCFSEVPPAIHLASIWRRCLCVSRLNWFYIEDWIVLIAFLPGRIRHVAKTLHLNLCRMST